MAITLDHELLSSLGLDALRPETKADMLRDLYQEHKLRVGETPANSMTDQPFDEFEALVVDAADRSLALAWLEKIIPSYRDVVDETIEALKAEITSHAPQVLAADRAAISGAA